MHTQKNTRLALLAGVGLSLATLGAMPMAIAADKHGSSICIAGSSCDPEREAGGGAKSRDIADKGSQHSNDSASGPSEPSHDAEPGDPGTEPGDPSDPSGPI